VRTSRESCWVEEEETDRGWRVWRWERRERIGAEEGEGERTLRREARRRRRTV
jgi:hypothetical protein